MLSLFPVSPQETPYPILPPAGFMKVLKHLSTDSHLSTLNHSPTSISPSCSLSTSANGFSCCLSPPSLPNCESNPIALGWSSPVWFSKPLELAESPYLGLQKTVRSVVPYLLHGHMYNSHLHSSHWLSLVTQSDKLISASGALLILQIPIH